MTYLYDASPPGLLIALYVALLTWAIIAYLTAAVTGARVLSIARDETPPRPVCLITDSTRWVFGRRMSEAGWTARDFIRLGVFFTVLVALWRIVMLGTLAADVSAIKPPVPYQLWSVLLHGISGSTLIIMHCGLALLYRQGADNDGK